MISTYFGHPIAIVRRGRKNTCIRFESGRTKVVPNDSIKEQVVKAC
ncbi:MAG: hypothetical protein KGR26_06165 [Cyanobacteria bacterium REEB65]|nr:hypothetical protein [Cyanobacteria bacterium REEB65]